MKWELPIREELYRARENQLFEADVKFEIRKSTNKMNRQIYVVLNTIEDLNKAKSILYA